MFESSVPQLRFAEPDLAETDMCPPPSATVLRVAKGKASGRRNQPQQIITELGHNVRYEGSALVVDSKGMEQSWSDGARPDLLEFEYMQHLDIFLQAAKPFSTRDRVLHAGAGACALAKAWERTRQDSTHLAVDMDDELIDFLKDSGWIKPNGRIRLRVGDARAVLEGSTASYDVIVRDAFLDDTTPPPLTTVEWAELAKSRLRPGGLYLANVAHGPQNSGKNDVAATAAVFGNVAVITDPKVWRSARSGNLAIAGWDGYDLDWAKLNEGIRRLPLPARAFTGVQVSNWLAGTKPARD